MYLKKLFSSNFTLFIILVIKVEFTIGAIKKWSKSKDFKDALNWKNKALPCSGIETLLPDNSKGFLNSKISTSFLTFGKDSEIIFGNNGQLELDTRHSSNCNTKERAIWSPEDGYWYDPYAWSTLESTESADPVLSTAIPHTHRTPCQFDSVLFTDPDDSFFTLILESPRVTVSTLQMGNTSYSTSGFSNWMKTEEGLLRISGSKHETDGGEIIIEDIETCQISTGCPCRSSDVAAEAKSKICSKIKQCPNAQCEKPIRMEGFCCPVCGSDLKFDPKQTVGMNKIEEILSLTLKSSDIQSVDGYASKMEDGLIHVFFTDGRNGLGDFELAAEKFLSFYISETGSVTPELQAAQGAFVATRNQETNAIISVVVVLVFLAFIVVGVYYYKNKRPLDRSESFSFRRLSRRISMASVGSRRRSSSISSNISTSAYSRESGLRFSNPVFNQSMASLAALNENESTEERNLEETKPGENPMYDVMENLSIEQKDDLEPTQILTKGQFKPNENTLIAIPEDDQEEIDNIPDNINAEAKAISLSGLLSKESKPNADTDNSEQKKDQNVSTVSFSNPGFVEDIEDNFSEDIEGPGDIVDFGDIVGLGDIVGPADNVDTEDIVGSENIAGTGNFVDMKSQDNEPLVDIGCAVSTSTENTESSQNTAEKIESYTTLIEGFDGFIDESNA